jgi:hypothetical protein
MISYGEARNKGATHEEAKKIEKLSRDGMLCRDGGLYAECAGLSYGTWRRFCK